MFEVYIIDCKRHFFQNALRLKKQFSQYFDSVFLLSGIGISNKEKNLINVGNFEFGNAFNQILRMSKSKYCIFIDSSLIIPNMNVVLERLNIFKNNFLNICGTYAFHTEGLYIRPESKKEIYQKIFQVNYHNLDFFVIEKTILYQIGLLTCIPETNLEGLEFILSWINLKNKKFTLLDEFFYFNRIFGLKREHKQKTLEKHKMLFDTTKEVYDLNDEFMDFYMKQI